MKFGWDKQELEIWFLCEHFLGIDPLNIKTEFLRAMEDCEAKLNDTHNTFQNKPKMVNGFAIS
jgi:hypothetical protein